MSKKLQAYLATAFVFIVVLICTIVAFKSKGFIDSADGLSHYQIAHYAFKHPENFVQHWGKPLFTLFAAPFAQIGYPGLVIMNLLFYALSCYAIFKISQFYNWQTGFLAPLFLIGSPMYFITLNAGLTETLMATLTIFSLYLFVHKRVLLATIVLSFSVVSRPESFLAIPLFGILLLFTKNWKYIPLLATGFLTYSLIGFLYHHHDFWWLISKSPYPSKSPYGSGSIFHFVKNANRIFGFHHLLFLGIAFFFMLYRLLKKQEHRILLFAISTLLGTVAVHSYLWYAGSTGSFGLLRVIATIMPLATLLTCYGFSEIIKLPYKSNALKYSALGISLFFLTSGVINGLAHAPIYRVPDPMALQFKKAADWYNANTDKTKRVAYLMPLFAYYAAVDPMDKEKTILIWSVNSVDPSISLEKGAYIVWDSELSPREGQMPREMLFTSPSVEVVYQHQEESEGLEIIIAKVIK